MKKVFLMGLLLCCLLSSTAFASNEVEVYLNGSALNFDVAPRAIDWRTVVPMRTIFEALGAEVEWDQATQSITATKGDDVIELQLNNKEMVIGLNVYILDVAPFAVDGRTLVPLRAVAEGLGVDVSWYGEISTVSIHEDVENIEYTKLYNPGGSLKDVEASLRDKYLAVGWGETEDDLKTTMYTLEGKTKSVFKDNIEAYEKLGWYVEPVCTMYAPDSRRIIIPQAEVEAYVNVGWYTEPVYIMYAPDGRTTVVTKDEMVPYITVGWYTRPVRTMYAPDGRSVVIEKTEIEAYMNDGWYFTKEAANKAHTTQPSHTHIWVPTTVHHDEIGYYIRSYGKQKMIICQGCFRAYDDQDVFEAHMYPYKEDGCTSSWSVGEEKVVTGSKWIVIHPAWDEIVGCECSICGATK